MSSFCQQRLVFCRAWKCCATLQLLFCWPFDPIEIPPLCSRIGYLQFKGGELHKIAPKFLFCCRGLEMEENMFNNRLGKKDIIGCNSYLKAVSFVSQFIQPVLFSKGMVRARHRFSAVNELGAALRLLCLTSLNLTLTYYSLLLLGLRSSWLELL